MIRLVGAVGRVLISAGILILLFVAYQLWGTNVHEASAQRELDREFAELLTQQPVTTTTPPPTTIASTTASSLDPPSTAPPVTAPPDLPLPIIGGAVARIEIPKISVDKTVVEGVNLAELNRAPGHYPGTPLPGQKGNVAIAGHRTTYGAPFGDIDELDIGDDVIITTVQGRFTYRIDATRVVAPSAVEVLDDKGDDRLTLTACHPKYSARQRIVVSGVLVGLPVATMRGQDRPQTGLEAEMLPADVVGRSPAKKLDGGLSGVDASTRPTLVWGAICAAIFGLLWLATHQVRRRTDRRLLGWVPYLVGAPVFGMALYVFFENVARLLPSNY